MATVIKGYEVREEIGVGGFGSVYRAYQTAVGREVAVKIIRPEFANRPEFIRRFEAEAQLVARLEHLHIVPLYDYWREPTGAYLVMRYLRGGSLRPTMRSKIWTLETIGLLVEQICSALMIAHQANVIHRDIKPDNILLDEDKNAYLADFGIAKNISLLDTDPNASGQLIGSPAYFAPEQIRGMPLSPQTDIYSLGILTYELLAGKHPFEGTPPQGMIYKHVAETLTALSEVRPGLPRGLDEVLNRATAKKSRERYSDALTFAQAFRQAASAGQAYPIADSDTLLIDREDIEEMRETTPLMGTPIPPPTNPYKGLRAFQQADAPDFFGREALIQRLVARLDVSQTGTRFLAVVGPSGSGKSSVVRAGLVPALRRGDLPGSENWFFMEMFPGSDPLRELEVALLRIAVNPPESLSEQLRQNERGLVRTLKRVLPDDNSELVLMIDQFEETFTLVEDDEERLHFLDSIRAAVSDPRSRLRVVVTLRADFYDRPLIYGEFGELVRANTEVVLPMSKTDLERAIAAPAQRVGLVVEPDLVAAVVKDVGESTSALPLLQYALTEMFEHSDGKTLTLETYHEIDGVSGALARRAEEIYVRLPQANKAAAQQIFLRLVTLGEGTEDTRRRVIRSELITNEGSADAVLEQYGQYRLLTFDYEPASRQPTVEIAHEALIRAWPQLRKWLNASRDDLRTQRRVAEAAEEWANSDYDVSFLARGTRLEQFKEWRESTVMALNKGEKAYLQASIDEDQRRQTAERQRLAREDELERANRQRLSWLLAVFIVAATISTILAVLAYGQQQAAQQNAHNASTAVAIADAERSVAERRAAEARSHALAASAQEALSANNTDIALALALQAVDLDNPPDQSMLVLANAAYAPGTRRVLAGHNAHIFGVTFLPSGDRVLSASGDGTVRLWDLATGETLQVYTGHSSTVNAVVLSPNGREFISVSGDGSARRWDIASGRQLTFVRSLSSGLLSATYNPAGDVVLLGGADGIVYAWNQKATEFEREYTGHQGPVYALDHAGDSFVSGSGDTTARQWDTRMGLEERRFFGHTDRVFSVSLSPVSPTVLSADAVGRISLWDVRFSREVRRYFGHREAVNQVTFDATGQRIASASSDGSVRIWDEASGEELSQFRGHTGAVLSVAISPNSQQLISGAEDNTLRLWDIRHGAEAHRFDLNSAAFSVDTGEAQALAGLSDGRIVTLNTNTGEIITELQAEPLDEQERDAPATASISAAELSLDGERALSAGANGIITVWDLETGDALLRLVGHNNPVVEAAFGPNNDVVLSSARNGSLILWNLEDGSEIYRTQDAATRVTSLDFLPDGNTALLGTRSGSLLMMNLNDGSIRAALPGHRAAITDIELNADGTRALTSSTDGSVLLWDLEAETHTLRLEGHDDEVYGVAFSPDASLAITAGNDRRVILWDLQRGTALQRFDGHTAPVLDVAFLPSGDRAITASEDGTVRVWHVRSLPQIVTWTLENRYIIDFTCAQRAQYRIQPECSAEGTPVAVTD